MSASLVGSEMCIRDSSSATHTWPCTPWWTTWTRLACSAPLSQSTSSSTCLLYTSDAADDM
eukprot:1318774-Alexandrium_andersonii.AAC.1